MNLKLVLSFAGLALSLAAGASADIVVYYEANGQHLPALDGNGALTGTGGAFSGMNVSNVPANQWHGVEDGAFQIVVGGNVQHYVYGVLGTPYFGQSTTTTLFGGPQNGRALTNSGYLGVSNGQAFYRDDDGSLSRYFELGSNLLAFDPTWTTFSGGGQLDGQGPGLGNGFREMGGSVTMSENYWTYVESDGTFGYYWMDTGTYAPGLEAAWGGWTTLQNGPLAGLTLSMINGAAIGTAPNGTQYRYLGIGDDGIYFDVVVPAPSAAAVMGLAGLVAGRRRR